jgi:hypothetical protein
VQADSVGRGMYRGVRDALLDRCSSHLGLDGSLLSRLEMEPIVDPSPLRPRLRLPGFGASGCRLASSVGPGGLLNPQISSMCQAIFANGFANELKEITIDHLDTTGSFKYKFLNGDYQKDLVGPSSSDS